MDKMTTLAHKIRLTPTPEQVTYFKKACGTARFVYNWALAEWQTQYRAGGKPSALGLKTQFNAIKRTAFPWMSDVTKCAPEGAFRNIGKAFANFFAKRANFPKFKRRGVHDRFAIDNSKFSVDGKRVNIPKLGWVRMTEALRFSGKIMNGVVSRIADQWFLSITVQGEFTRPQGENQATVGVDLGINTLATLSTGETVANPRALRQTERRLARLQRKLSTTQTGSRRRDNARMRVARLYARIACVRQDATHKLTTWLTRRFQTIVIENLRVNGMIKNRKLAKHIADANFAEIRRQLTYKARWSGQALLVADRWFPSSKMCSHCGAIHPALTLADRMCVCPACGHRQDRDLNAAVNLMHDRIGRATAESTPGE